MKMDESPKELIATVASFTTHCQPCSTFHVDKAINLGIGDDEIYEAIAIGRMIQKGAISAMNKFAENVIVSSENKPSAYCSIIANNCCH